MTRRLKFRIPPIFEWVSHAQDVRRLGYRTRNPIFPQDLPMSLKIK
jgi:hypothetical protein